MKNLFLIKKIKILFSFGKDSIYSFYKFFYKKKKMLFLNYNNKKHHLFSCTSLININFFSNNELIYRKLKFGILKLNINNIFVTNHHFLDYFENFLINFLKNKKINNQNWFFKKKYFIKPLINYFLKNYKIHYIDNTNKNIKIKRNFFRCLISKFIK